MVVWRGALAARAAAPVVGDHSSESSELVDRVGPREHGAARAVDAKDRGTTAPLFVVEADGLG